MPQELQSNGPASFFVQEQCTLDRILGDLQCIELKKNKGANVPTSTIAAGTARTLVESWHVYCSSCGHSAVAPLKLGSCMRMRGPAQALPTAGGSAMLHTGASRPCELGFHGCSQLRRSSLCRIILWPPLLLSSASVQRPCKLDIAGTEYLNKCNSGTSCCHLSILMQLKPALDRCAFPTWRLRSM